ncbi:Uma2 family endonuclease [Roseofilum casamattae]|uniref:Uma2 family endonuclease n=1 Tax=Roseofilum casamattae BLCC-M143 TaxID=3022442 RepID=A0ABT7BZR0_9CYAN|nr:Uma2 family endonuclease [Roseofilum casamattae]MDJ1184697.1 Uma2 family endonuclease [Roseofilum casamattae BLCC-M143]
MVTALSSPTEPQVSPGNRIILNGVSWLTFTTLLAEVGDDRAWRIAYHERVLEIRMPLSEHERAKGMLESFVEAIADELEIEVMKLGALTLKREDVARAVEPDSCFYIQNESLVRSKAIQLPDDPPPDLAIESDYTNSSLNKFTLYAGLGVPELWRYARDTLQVYRLVDGEYQAVDKSLAFPFLPVDEVPRFLAQSKDIGQRSAVRLFRQRIRQILENETS